MSTLPTPDNGYAVHPETFATVAFFQAVFSSVHARLNGVEAIAVDYDETIARLTTEALETVSATLSVEIADQRALLTGIQASAEAVLAAYDQISLTGVPATQIRVLASDTFNPGNVQAAIEAFKTHFRLVDIDVADAKERLNAAEERNASQDTAIGNRLRFDIAQILNGQNLARAQTNLKAILTPGVLGGWYEPSGVRIIGATGTNWLWDLPASAKEWRLTLRGPRPANGGANLTLRCGSTGSAADAGASDYFDQNYNIANAAFASGSAAASSPSPLTFVAGPTAKRVVIEGSLGSDVDVWTSSATAQGAYPGAVVAGHQFSYRQAFGRKPRLFLTSDVNLVGGDFIVEVRD